MSGDPESTAVLALHRFGFGPRPQSAPALLADPKAALLAELDAPDAGRLPGDFLSTEQLTREFHRLRDELRKARLEAARRKRENSADRSDGEAVTAEPKRKMRSFVREHYRKEVRARIEAALGAEAGFVERLVWFWSNHFCIAAPKAYLRTIAGPFEREAIRAHVLGRFYDMLLAVETHPAMLLYLGNVRSTGPYSETGLESGVGLNENLGREVLELHTLGVRTGYSQADVTRFSKALTGWTVPNKGPVIKRGGHFEFDVERHEPGDEIILGKRYPDTGFDQARAVLADVARRPATARHIATKLAAHFVADSPPQPLIDRLAKRFLDTDGDLKEVARALIQSPEAWDPRRLKFKRPSGWLVSALRAVGAREPHAAMLLRAQRALGEPLWAPPAPKGFSDRRADWINGLAERLDVANGLADLFASDAEPKAVLGTGLGGLASEETRSAVARAGDRTQALALLFMAPEFQLR